MIPSLAAAFFFFNDTATTEIYTLSLHDALPICPGDRRSARDLRSGRAPAALAGSATLIPGRRPRSEEHTSELQSRRDLVCRLLLEKKKITKKLGSESESLAESLPEHHVLSPSMP